MNAYSFRVQRSALWIGLAAIALSAGIAGTSSAQQSSPMRGDRSQLVMSGGVGYEGRAELAQHEREANLKLVFTEPQGSYLSDIGVKVYDRSGALVLDTTSAGPWVLAKLTPGSYRIVTTDGNVRKESQVSVGQGLKVVHIRMPEQGGIPGRPTIS